MNISAGYQETAHTHTKMGFTPSPSPLEVKGLCGGEGGGGRGGGGCSIELSTASSQSRSSIWRHASRCGINASEGRKRSGPVKMARPERSTHQHPEFQNPAPPPQRLLALPLVPFNAYFVILPIHWNNNIAVHTHVHRQMMRVVETSEMR